MVASRLIEDLCITYILFKELDLNSRSSLLVPGLLLSIARYIKNIFLSAILLSL